MSEIEQLLNECSNRAEQIVANYLKAYIDSPMPKTVESLDVYARDAESRLPVDFYNLINEYIDKAPNPTSPDVINAFATITDHYIKRFRSHVDALYGMIQSGEIKSYKLNTE